MEQTLNVYLAAREALFRNPSDEAACAWWTSEGYAPPTHPCSPFQVAGTRMRCSRASGSEMAATEQGRRHDH